MIGTTKQQIDKLGSRIVQLAQINLGARQNIEGKQRITDSTGALRNSLGFRVKQNRTAKGEFSSGFKLEFTSSVDYASFIEQGVRGSQASPVGTKDSPFKFKGRNVAEGVMMKWIESKPIKLRDMGTGKFSKNTKTAKKQLAFLLGRKVATQGIAPRHYFKDAGEQAVSKDGGEVAVAMALDWINESLKKGLK